MNATLHAPNYSLLSGRGLHPSRQWMRRRGFGAVALVAGAIVLLLVIVAFRLSPGKVKEASVDKSPGDGAIANGWPWLEFSVSPPTGTRQSISTSPQQQWLADNVFTKAAHAEFMDNGVFIEFGARDGLLDSNTLAFERDSGWRGILIEALPSEQRTLGTNRPRSAALDAAVCSSSRHVEFLHAAIEGWGGQAEHYDVARLNRVHSEAKVVRVACLPLAPLVDMFGITRINYMSVDTEGSELDALRGFPFDRVLVDVVGVEVLVGTEERMVKERELVEFMRGNGYRVLHRFAVSQDTFDLFFAAEDEKRRALDRGLPFVDAAVFDAAKATCKTLLRCL